MKILIDIEWYETDKHETALTQIAAARITDGFELIDTFDALFHPDIEVEDYSHLAFNGADTNDYLNAQEPETVLGDFLAWMNEDDVLYFWHESSALLLRNYLPGIPNKMKILQNRVRKSLPGGISSKGDTHAIAKRCGLNPKYPKHCSKNDVTVLLCLLVWMKRSPDDLSDDLETIVNLQLLTRRKMREQGRKASLILGKDINPIDGFRFVYNPKEKLLHRVDCPNLVWEKEYRGYATLRSAASKYQRGCGCCLSLLEEYHKRRKAT